MEERKNIVVITRFYYVYNDRQNHIDEFIEFGGLEEALEFINTNEKRQTIVGLFKRINTKTTLKD